MLIDKKSDFAGRGLSFDETGEGLSPKEAIAEAKRCLSCHKPSCRSGCPIENDIPRFIRALAQGNIGEASRIIAERNNLPAICGRVCPQERQCEAACVLAKGKCGIRIGKLERFIADFDAEMEIHNWAGVESGKGEIAVIGSGPAGLTVAGDLVKGGFSVTVFEGQPESGGVLMYGIPEFRLSKEVVRREIQRIARLGVEFRTNVLIGKDITIDDMFAQGFDAVFIGTGTALPRTLDLAGKDLPGIIPATYFLSVVNLVNSGGLGTKEILVHPRDRVVVVGAGNVAMDAARTALRLGVRKVTVVYRRTKQEMAASLSEYEQAKKEGVQFRWLYNPVRYIGKDEVEGLECEQLAPGEGGKTQPTGKKEVIPADKVLLAVGQRPAARIVSTTEGIKVNAQGYVVTRDRPYGMTTKTGVFAGGDVVHEPSTVVLAMKEAKKVAAGIAMYVEAKKLLEECR
jgi:glutamate synthase (NADPH/NADH) small chain